MKDGVMIINDSREQLIVGEDLRDVLNSGKMTGAVVDVVSTESIRINNPLLMANSCIITPHISWTSKEPRQGLMSITIDSLKAYMNGKPASIISE